VNAISATLGIHTFVADVLLSIPALGVRPQRIPEIAVSPVKRSVIFDPRDPETALNDH
jgi:hypothetical protein